VIKNYKCYSVFPTPVIKVRFLQHEKYKFKDLEKKDQKPERWQVPVRTTFPNIDEGDELIDSETLSSLKKDILNSIKICFRDLNIPTDISFEHFWYNAYWDNQGQEPHAHLNKAGGAQPFWSGVYYNKNSTPTIFDRQGEPLHKAFDFFGSQESKIRECYFTYWYTDVNDGDMLLFPPYLQHSIYTDDSNKDKMRLTFSFNLQLTR
jgi:hypothetical protein